MAISWTGSDHRNKIGSDLRRIVRLAPEVGSS